MHVRMSPRPHILINLDSDWPYWGDRVEFGGKYEPIFSSDPPATDDPQPDQVLGVPLGVYRRCTAELVSRLDSRIADLGRKEDLAGVARVSELCTAVRTHVDEELHHN